MPHYAPGHYHLSEVEQALFEQLVSMRRDGITAMLLDRTLEILNHLMVDFPSCKSFDFRRVRLPRREQLDMKCFGIYSGLH